jgi:hypothetical protein
MVHGREDHARQQDAEHRGRQAIHPEEARGGEEHAAEQEQPEHDLLVQARAGAHDELAHEIHLLRLVARRQQRAEPDGVDHPDDDGAQEQRIQTALEHHPRDQA